MQQAERDIRAGHLILRTFGIATPDVESPYARLLYEQLGVRLQNVGGCVVRAWTIDETAAYNETMKAEIARRFGNGALERIQHQALQPEEQRSAADSRRR